MLHPRYCGISDPKLVITCGSEHFRIHTYIHTYIIGENVAQEHIVNLYVPCELEQEKSACL